MLLLDPDGRPLRRAIGFELEWRADEPSEHDPVDLVADHEIEVTKPLRRTEFDDSP